MTLHSTRSNLFLVNCNCQSPSGESQNGLGEAGNLLRLLAEGSVLPRQMPKSARDSHLRRLGDKINLSLATRLTRLLRSASCSRDLPLQKTALQVPWISSYILIANSKTWPHDELDVVLLVCFLTLVFVAPAMGYWFMVLDIRAYLRALKGALMIVRDNLPHMPSWVRRSEWAKRNTPHCIRSLGLEMPCQEDDIKRAYRNLAEDLHPDRGGDRQQFMLLQQHFEAAIRYIHEE